MLRDSNLEKCQKHLQPREDKTYMTEKSRISIFLLPSLWIKYRMVVIDWVMKRGAKPAVGTGNLLLVNFPENIMTKLWITYSIPLQKDRVITSRTQRWDANTIFIRKLHFVDGKDFFFNGGSTISTQTKENTNIGSCVP